MKNNHEQKIREFISRNFPYSTSDYSGDSSLTDIGVLDSTGMLEVIDFLESEFNFKLTNDELTPENLDSVNGMAGLIERKRSR